MGSLSSRPRVARIVSLTPIAVESDSRTLKQASSMTRLGHLSVVVEGATSRSIDRDELLFELRSAGPPTPPGAAATAAMPSARGTRRPRGRLSTPVVRAAREVILVRDALRTQTNTFIRRTLAAAPRADVYYVHSYLQFPAAAMLARRHGARIVYDAHDFYPDAAHDGLTASERTVLRVHRLVERACVRRADAIVTVSPGVAELMQRRWGRTPTVVLNAHDRRLDRPAARTLREAVGLAADTTLIVMVGNAKREDAFENALRALDLMPAVHLALVGGGYDETHRELARGFGVQGRVHFLPAVRATELSAFIADADAAVILYRPMSSNFRNALPNRFFHAVAAGMPVLYPDDLPNLRALAERYDVGLPIRTGDPASIAAAVARLRDEPGLTRRLRDNALAAQGALSWERSEEILDALIGDLLAGLRAS